MNGMADVVPLHPAPPFSEDALACEFTSQHGDNYRYVAAWGRWLRWDDARWSEDSTLAVFDLSRAICRDAAATANAEHVQKSLASAKAVAAVERLARADRQHAATTDQWDSDPWLLNTPAGVVDLRTGAIRNHRRDDYLTKITITGPGGECPLWMAFLDRITASDDELQSYLQRVAGYGLTGLTRDHALFFCYGTGANGKSVLLNTIANILGDFHTSAPADLFLESYGNEHPTGLAGLRGARLVTATETDHGKRWAEAKVKLLTGGDRIAARFMRQDYFEFTPQFKLIVAGNHKPTLRAVDEAIRRRLHLIPFTVTIPPDERDDRLSEKLRAEWSGILAWMIEGAVEWGLTGLRPPEAVRAATDEYLEAEDALGQWIAEACMTSANNTASATHLYEAWRTWCERTGEKPGTQRSFSQLLLDKGYIREKTRTGRVFRGICPRPEEYNATLV